MESIIEAQLGAHINARLNAVSSSENPGCKHRAAISPLIITMPLEF